jgi:hypothetical protein
MSERHPLATAFLAYVLGFEPEAYARMNPHGHERKYTKIYRKLTPHLLAQHLQGEITLASSLIDPQGRAQSAVIDIDEGGEDALHKVIEQAQIRGLNAVALTSRTEEHDGGHVWVFFAEAVEPQRLRRLMQEMAKGAGIEGETYPTKKAIRLPLGKHTWTGQRGTLIFSDGERIELDSGIPTVREGLVKLLNFTKNPLSLLPQLPTSSREGTRSPERAGGWQERSDNPIQHYNQTTNLISYLESLGGRIAEEYPGGGVLMHCPCPNHKHGDAHASLEIKPSTNTSRYGQYVAYGYSQGCVFHTEHGQVVDAFSAYTKMEQLTSAEAVKKLYGSSSHSRPRANREHHTHQTQEDKSTGEAEEEDAAKENIQLAQDLLSHIRLRLAEDTELPKRARVVLPALLSIAGTRSWCRPSVARLAAMTGLCERSVYRALVDLTEARYIESDEPNGQTTTIRRFVRVTEQEANPVILSGEYRTCSDTTSTASCTCEAPPDVGVEAELVEAVSYPGGASYDPAQDQLDDERASHRRGWGYSLRPKHFYTLHRAHTDQAFALPSSEVAELEEQEPLGEQITFAIDLPEAIEPQGESVIVLPKPEAKRRAPRDKAKQQTYWRLLKKAEKVEKTNKKQAFVLRAQARELEEIELADAGDITPNPLGTDRPAGWGASQVCAPLTISADDPWVALQRYHFEKAVAKGDRARVAWYASFLDGLVEQELMLACQR